MNPASRWALVAFGGALGSVARYALGSWIQARAGLAFPWGTFTVNLLASGIVGFVLRAATAGTLGPEARLFLAVGFCGGLSTFSTLAWETWAMLQQGEILRAVLYTQGSLLAGLLALALGYATAAALLP